MASRLVLSVVAGLAPLVTACIGVDTYDVGVHTAEVQEGALTVQLDTSAEEPVMRVVFAFGAREADRCPVLRDDAAVVIESAGGRTELALDSRGGGYEVLDCAVKCHAIVATEVTCAPLHASLSGAAVATLMASNGARVALEDASGSAGVMLDATSLEPRVSQVANTVLAERNLPSEYRFTSVPFAWSHEGDAGFWVNQWDDNYRAARDGEFSAFTFDDTAAELAFRVRGDIAAGPQPIFFGATAAAAGCEVGACNGVEHVTRTDVTIAYP